MSGSGKSTISRGVAEHFSQAMQLDVDQLRQMMGSLALGLPQVILPQHPRTDQGWNGERCVARGVGLMLKPDQATPEAIRAAVRAVQIDPAYRRNAQAVAAEIAALPGLEHAVDLLENLVAAHKSPSQKPR